MTQLILTLLGISLSAALLFTGKSYLSDATASRHAAVLERNVVENTKAIEKAFLECRRMNECRAVSTTGTSLSTPSGTDTRPVEIRQLSSYLGINPASADGLEYKARLFDGGKRLVICITPKTDAGGAAPFAKPFTSIAFERMGGPSTGTNPYATLTGFTYNYQTTAPSSYSTCNPLVNNAKPSGNYYLGATRVVIDY